MPSLKMLVDPDLRALAEELFDQAHDADPRFTVTSVVRSRREQERLYREYQEALAAGEEHLPAAVPGTSKHELGLAFDMARPGIDPFEDDLLPELGALWEEAGGVWGGRFNDPVHFEAPKGYEPDVVEASTKALGFERGFERITGISSLSDAVSTFLGFL